MLENDARDYLPHYVTTEQEGICANKLRKIYCGEVALISNLDELGPLRIFPRHIDNFIRFARQRHQIRADICFVVSNGAVGRSRSPISALALKLDERTYCIVFDLQLLAQILVLTTRFCMSTGFAEYFQLDRVEPEVIAETDLFAASLLPTALQMTNEQALYQTVLWGQIIGFVTAHEFAHIKNGHVDFIGKAGHGEAVLEHETAEHVRDYYLTRQTLEMDADCIGFSLVSAYLEFALHPNIVPDKSPHKDIEFLYFMLLLGVNFSFLIFSASTLDRDQAISAHPKPLLRLGIVFSLVQDLLWHADRDDRLERLEFLCRNSSELVMGALRESFPNVRLNPAAIGFIPDADAEAYSTSLLRRWAKIRPELLPLVLGGGLAPAHKDFAT